MAKNDGVFGNKANASSGSKIKGNELARGPKPESDKKESKQKLGNESEIDRQKH